MQQTGNLSISTGIGTQAEVELSPFYWGTAEINNLLASVPVHLGMTAISKYQESNRQLVDHQSKRRKWEQVPLP